MKRMLFFALLLLPVWVWGQRELVIEGPNDKVAPVVLQVKSDFDQDKGVMVEPPKSFFMPRNMFTKAPAVRYQSTPLCS